MPTMRGGGDVGEEWVTVTCTGSRFPHMDLVAISLRSTSLVPSALRTRSAANSTSSFPHSSMPAAMAQMWSFSSAAAFSTAFPVTYMVLDA